MAPSIDNGEFSAATMGQGLCFSQNRQENIKPEKKINPPHLRTGKLEYITFCGLVTFKKNIKRSGVILIF